MRREKRDQGNRDTVKNIMYLGGSILGIGIIAFILTFVIYSTNLDKQQAKIDTEKFATLVKNTTNTINTETASTNMGKTVEESKNEMEQNKIENITNITKSNIVEEKNNTITNNTNKQTTKAVNKTEATKKQNTEDPIFIKPVEGEISKEYAKDNLVYSETLKEWTTHLGIDIKAEKTTVVKSACDGKVKSIKTDPRYGLSIIIEHQNGFETLYSNLLTSEFVQVGEEVKQGQTIGTVGNTATFEIADESHLHFEISKDGEKVNPNSYIK